MKFGNVVVLVPLPVTTLPCTSPFKECFNVCLKMADKFSLKMDAMEPPHLRRRRRRYPDVGLGTLSLIWSMPYRGYGFS